MEDAPTGLALVDAPDVDSIEHANRVLADRLVESADLAVFVTTGTRYADRVAWDVLERARDRGLPLIVVANRLPADPAERAVMLADIDRLIEEQGLRGLGLAGDGALRSVDVVAVGEGDLDPGTPEALVPSAVELLRRRIDDLAADRDARSALAARALAGSLSGLRADVDALADELEHAAIDLDALARTARDAFAQELSTLREDLARGMFLRAEALRQWQAFVGADEVAVVLIRHRAGPRHDLRARAGHASRPRGRGPRGTPWPTSAASPGARRRSNPAHGDPLGGPPAHGIVRRPRCVAVGAQRRLRRPVGDPARALARRHRRGCPGDRRAQAAAGEAPHSGSTRPASP